MPVVFSGTGGRGGKACEILRGLGYSNCHNGGGPAHIASARGIAWGGRNGTGGHMGQARLAILKGKNDIETGGFWFGQV